MTRREFLDRLDRCLASVEAGERASMVEFYSEQIDDRMDDGMTEEQAVASLETPEDIAANILSMRGADAGGTSGNAGNAGGAAPVQAGKRGILRTIGRAVLGFCEVLLAIMLIPVAAGIVMALLGAYLSLWCADIGLAVASLAGVFLGGLGIVSCIVAPPASVPVGIATGALIVGALSATVLLAIATYFFGKLLVMLVVWSVRGIGALVRRRGGKAPVQAKRGDAYPSMPMPPMADGRASKRGGRLPLWGAFAIVAATLGLTSVFAGLGAMAAAGGPEQLLEQAGLGSEVHVLSVDADKVDTIDLSLSVAPAQKHVRVAIGVSPDDEIHVTGWSPAVFGWFYAGDLSQPYGELDGSTVRLAQTSAHGMSIQNPLTALNVIYQRSGRLAGDVEVLIPQGWNGSVVCSGGAGFSVYTTRVWSQSYDTDRSAVLQIEGDIVLDCRDVQLRGIAAHRIAVNANNIGLSEATARDVSLNESRSYGTVSAIDVTVSGALCLGGATAYITNVESRTLDVRAGTDVYEDHAPTDGPGDGAAQAEAEESAEGQTRVERAA